MTLEGRTWKKCKAPEGSKPPCACGRLVHAKGMCSACYNRNKIATDPEYRARQIDRWKKRYHADEEFRTRVKAHARKHEKKQNPTQRRARKLRLYGITVADEQGMLLRQNGLCQLCPQPPKTGRILVVDHCHETGKVRGLICKRCNTGLGFFRDNPRTFARAAAYLMAAQEPEDDSC